MGIWLYGGMTQGGWFMYYTSFSMVRKKNHLFGFIAENTEMV